MSFIDKKIYPYLPVAFQNLAISAYGWYWKQRRFGGIYSEAYRGFKERESFSFSQWHDYQTIELRKLLSHAFETVPYYHKSFKKAGFELSRLKKFEISDLEKIPILSKEDLRKYGTTELLSKKREKSGRFFQSSGSTGTPVSILYSHAFHQRINAAMEARVRNWAGITFRDPRGMIGGRRILPKAEAGSPFYRYNFFENQTYFSAYHISEANALSYLKGIKKNKVAWMTGYAVSNYLLAKLFDELKLEVPPLKAVITSSEKLDPMMRQVLEEVYKCKVFDSYSGVENCALISQNVDELFINPDVGIVEIQQQNNAIQVASSLEGDIICTGLLNWDQPLIRYQIGDQIKMASKQSASIIQMPLVEEIIGRTEDVIQTSDGRIMVRFHGIFTGIDSIQLGQVIQKSLLNFIVRIQTSRTLYKEEILQIEKRMKSQVGAESTIQVEQVSSIPLSKNGKFKAVISELA